ncbi:DUF6477 family protein [Cohaesibacter sp. ES.047]|uniref:DUF6477 family protein n=1 Tax=Cohaesibacter sp. ES.047 TaxID=1798205 RepID=UPI001FCE9540|nr:DUF6477 family protein [Cohaesibacter sp. ES.047]
MLATSSGRRSFAPCEDGRPSPIAPPSPRGLVEAQLRHGESEYRRYRDLPGLLHLFPDEIKAMEHRDLLSRLLLALRAERRRGRASHWRYSLSRHIALWQAFRSESRKSPKTEATNRRNIPV